MQIHAAGQLLGKVEPVSYGRIAPEWHTTNRRERERERKTLYLPQRPQKLALARSSGSSGFFGLSALAAGKLEALEPPTPPTSRTNTGQSWGWILSLKPAVVTSGINQIQLLAPTRNPLQPSPETDGIQSLQHPTGMSTAELLSASLAETTLLLV